MRLDGRVALFVVLSAVFVTCLVVGDIIGGKLVELPLFGTFFTLSVGMIPFPITFLLTDLLNEFYGKKAARFVTLVGFAMALLTFSLIGVATALPFAAFTHQEGWDGVHQEGFNNVFAGSQRILIASMIAYLVAQFVDIGVFHLLKRWSHNRFLWLRATGSTVVSQLIDTAVIQTVAWWGILPFVKVVNVAASSYFIKLLVAIGLTPLIYAGHSLVERLFGMRPVQLDEEGNPIEPAVEVSRSGLS